MNDPLRKYRRQFRIWRKTRQLIRELEFYERRFTSLGLTIPTGNSIRQTLQKRFPTLRPKPKGALKIISIYHHYNWENFSLKPALEKFGSVHHFDWAPLFDHSLRDWRYRKKPLMNQHLLNQVDKWFTEERADVIFTYLSGELVYPETLASLKKYEVPIINLALNDKEHFVGKVRNGLAFGSRDICRYFDLCWTSTEDALKKYVVEGAIPLYLPEGANPEVHKPYPLEKDIDVSFVGQCYGNRQEIINGLRASGIQVAVYGTGWPNGPLSLDNMIKLYSRSKINLGFGGVSGHKDTYCLKGRDFEVPMSGGLYITEDHRELALVYQVGKEILTYRNLGDLVEKIKYLLANPEIAEEIRKAGYARARRDHTWEMRFEQVFRLMNLLQHPPETLDGFS